MTMLRRLLRNPNLIYKPEFSEREHCGWSWTINKIKKQELLTELYYCRWWMKNIGVLEMDHRSLIKNKLFQMGYWLSGQGIDPNNPTWMLTSDSNFSIAKDYLRLLRTTNSLILPSKSIIRLLASSDDVTHSWAVPGIGLKVDCVPGRLFSVFTIIDRDGVYFGQCSELCGWNHYNMPITIHAIPFHHFLTWWELELHAMYNEPINKYNSFLKFLKNASVDYYYLNLKYK
jgi:heme/copper-type cytochrome/quinol oxidase subunit 2